MKRSLDGSDTYYLGANYEIQVDPGGQQLTVHHRLNGQHVASEIDGQLLTLTNDQLGSTTATIDAAGAITTQRYTPYGAIRGAVADNQLAIDFTFTGQTDDPGTGLIDYNARPYDPQMSRFVQADTILADLNHYTYVYNNPLKYIDPSGHCTEFVPSTGECIFHGNDWTFVHDIDKGDPDYLTLTGKELEREEQKQSTRSGRPRAGVYSPGIGSARYAYYEGDSLFLDFPQTGGAGHIAGLGIDMQYCFMFCLNLRLDAFRGFQGSITGGAAFGGGAWPVIFLAPTDGLPDETGLYWNDARDGRNGQFFGYYGPAGFDCSFQDNDVGTASCGGTGYLPPGFDFLVGKKPPSFDVLFGKKGFGYGAGYTYDIVEFGGIYYAP